MDLSQLPRMKVCNKCSFGKTLDKFYFRTSWNGKDYPTYICKECHSKKSKNNIQEWKKLELCWHCGNERNAGGNFCLKCKEKNRTNIIKRKIKNKQKAVELLGGKCSKCGLKTNCLDVYDFHHKDPSKKAVEVGKILAYSWVKILPEIEKCELLCGNCHRIETSENTIGNTRYKEIGVNDKRCRINSCMEFTGDRIYSRCENHREIATKLRVENRKNKKSKVIEILGFKCIKCGIQSDDTIIFDVHHNNPEIKTETLSNLMSRSFKRIEKELIDTSLICCNCHRLLHSKEVVEK